MGQKINPNGFRVGVNKNWLSGWFSPKSDYADTLNSDLKVREYLSKELKNAGLAEVIIKRYSNKVTISISVARPGVVIGRGGTGIEKVKKDLQKLVGSAVDLKVFEVKKPEASAQLIADNIASQLERRIVPKFACQRAIETAKQTQGVKGVRIWVSGRIKGAEIARTEKFQWGTVPLQTLRADIDYAHLAAQVPNAGKNGIKVWVYKGEKHDYQIDE
ncbi:MAG: 30S ribosomal protein S3 [Candidatus Dojkabacteria bacterium]